MSKDPSKFRSARTTPFRLIGSMFAIFLAFGFVHDPHSLTGNIFGDKGRASYASMSMAELNTACTDPLKFFRKHLE